MVIKVFNLKIDLIELYNQNKKLVASKNKNFYFCVPYGGYKVKLYYKGNLLGVFSIFYSIQNRIFCYYFNNKHKKIYLTDYHYSGLKIERGNLYLWNII